MNWALMLFILVAASTVAVDAETQFKPDSVLSSSFNPRLAADTVADFLHTHPTFDLDVLLWLLAGTVLWVAGLAALLVSEIGAALVCRDQDFRERLLQTEAVNPRLDAEQYKDLISRENKKLDGRPYVSVLGMLLLLFGTAAVVVPLCDVLSIIGLPEMPCLVLATGGALLSTICFVTFVMGTVWSCTRPWAAAVLYLVSLSGLVLLPSGNPLLLLAWLLLAFGGGYVYFFTIPEQCARDGVAPPFYVQGIGVFTVELSAGRFTRAVSDVGETVADAVRPASWHAQAPARAPRAHIPVKLV